MTQATYGRKGLFWFTVLDSIVVWESWWFEPKTAGRVVSTVRKQEEDEC